MRPQTWRFRTWPAAALHPLECTAALHAQAPASATLSLRGNADYVGAVSTDLARIPLAADPLGPRDPAR